MAKRTPPQAPAFRRRAIASDIMTWHYETPERLALHLKHDRRFVPWMAEQGLNALFYIRHAVDSRLKIGELTPLLNERAIAGEYGGHVLPLLLPRDFFGEFPKYFPQDASGQHNPKGNLCVSNRTALELVSRGASRYLDENPECALLHIWGADVWDGAWCHCGDCAALSPQRQYMAVVNALAETIAERSNPPPLAWLAYHDTIDADPALRPHPLVACEWAPRERCYSHSIDDASCAVNPRYFESLKQYIQIFDGRVHVFEYYADAILFGGLAIATPAVIVSDLKAYRALGIDSISCLAFGEHSWLAYPVNLAVFARATQTLDCDPAQFSAQVSAARYPQCAAEVARAYDAIARASALILDGGGDVMRPRVDAASTIARTARLRESHRTIAQALDAMDHLEPARGSALAGEREVWRFSRDLTAALAEYVAAAGNANRARGEAATRQVAAALEKLQTSGPSYQNTWAAYDLEWITEIWLGGLQRRIGLNEKS